jgi:hypothetical protein
MNAGAYRSGNSLFFWSDLKCKPALRNVTENCNKYVDKGIRYRGPQPWKKRCEELDQEIVHQNERNGNKCVSEQLNSSVQIGFWKHNMP